MKATTNITPDHNPAEDLKLDISVIIAELDKIAVNGITEEYDSFEDYLFDFYPSFSWEHWSVAVRQLNLLLTHTRLIDRVSKKVDFDLTKELQQVLTAALSDERNR